MAEVLVAYVPVLHQGYLQFFSRYPQAKKLFLIGKDFTEAYRPLVKDIRALAPEQMQKMVASLEIFDQVQVLTLENVAKLSGDHIIMPDEDISHLVADKYFSSRPVTFDTIFLRWDRQKSLEENQVETDQTISSSAFSQKMMQKAQSLAKKSSDWWRQVGAVLVKDGQVITTAYNRHLPTDQEPYQVGDPRANFHRGEHLDKTTAIHAEAAVIAQAARQGLSTEGASIYVTTFPCPTCAKLVAESGIKELYFEKGYGMLDGQEVLKRHGIKIERVKEASIA